MEDANAVDQIHLSDYWNVLKKRKMLVIVFTLIAVTVTALVSFRMEPIFQASARVAIERETTSSPISGQRLEYIDMRSQFLTFNTHFTLIRSKPVIENLLVELGNLSFEEDMPAEELSTNPVLEILGQAKAAVKRLKNNVRLLLKKEAVIFSDQELHDMQVRALQGQIEVTHIPDTRIMNISVMDTNPKKAALIANLLAKNYIEFDMASRMATSKATLEWLNKELYSLKKRLEDDEKNFYEYKRFNKVFSLTGKQKVIDQKISEFNNDYLTIRNKRQELDAKLSEVKKLVAGTGNVAHIRSIVSNSSIDTIYSNLTNLELELTRLAKVYKDKHPKIQQISSEIAKVKSKLESELKKELENLKVQQQVYITRENVLEKNLAEFEEDALDTSGKELKYTILQRNMLTSQNLYDTLVTKIKESNVISGASSSNLRVLENASPPIAPIKPNKKKNILLSLLLGIFGGVAMAFFLEYLDQSLRTEEDVVNYLDLPVLSVIPVADKVEKGRYY